MNIFKWKKSKLLLSTTSIVGLSTLLVSCGTFESNQFNNKHFAFDIDHDNKIIFGHSFSSSNTEAKTLAEIVKQWNEQAKNLPGFLPMELQAFANGYGGATQSIQTFLKTKDKKKIPNIVTNYPSLLAIVNSTNMALPIIHDFKSSKPSGSEAEQQLYNTLKQDGVSAFLDYNSEIPLLDSKGIYSLPFAKSSQILSIDKMVLAYIVDKAMSDPNTQATIAPNDKLFEEISQIKAGGQHAADLAEVEKIWKDYKSIPVANGGLAGYQFSSKVFENYTDTIDLADRIVKTFPNSVTQGNDLTKARGAFGIDNAATSFFSMVTGYNNGDRSKGIAVLNTKNNRVDYNSYWKDTSSPRYQAFKAAYDVLDNGINNKSVYIASAGEYNSLYLKNHQEAFSLGSSAGYKYNYFPKNKTQFVVQYQDSTGANKTTVNINPQFAALINKRTHFGTGTQGRYTLPSLLGNNKTINIYEETKKDLDKIIENIGDKTFIYFTAKSIPTDLDVKSTETLKFPENFKYFPFILKNVSSYENQDTNSKLNEDETQTLPGPEKFNKNSEKHSIVSQGADLIAIHANKKEDEAVRLFLNWLLNTKVRFPKGDSGVEEITPIEYWVQQTSYIAPYKPTFENTSFSTDSNAGKRITWTEFNKFLLNDNANNKYQLIYDTADAQSASFRDKLGTTMSAVLSKAQVGDRLNFDQFLEELQVNLGPKFK